MMRKPLGLTGLTISVLALVAVPGSPAIAATAHPVITHSDTTSATIQVPVAGYKVQVTATTTPCWVQAKGGSQLLFQGVLQPHRTRTFSALHGKMTVQLGSAHSRVTVLIHGKTVPHWAYTPKNSPYGLSFTSVQ